MGKFQKTITALGVARRMRGLSLISFAATLLASLVANGQTSGGISPPQGPSGQPITVLGYGWNSAVEICLVLPDGSRHRALRVQPDSDGHFAAHVFIPRFSAGDPSIPASGVAPIGIEMRVAPQPLCQPETTTQSDLTLFYTATAQPAGCVDAYFIGAHGVGEGSDDTDPTLSDAPELMETWNTLAWEASLRNPGKTLNYSLLAYHAPEFASWTSDPNDVLHINSDIADGVGRLNTLIQNVLLACPTQRFVFNGHSFGAWVIYQFLSDQSNSASFWDQIIAVQLYGDPVWHRSGQDGTYQGLAHIPGTTLPNPSLYTSNLPISGKWQSFCLENDPVCGEGVTFEWQLGAVITCVHNGCAHVKYNKVSYDDDQPTLLTNDITTRGGYYLLSMAFPSSKPEIFPIEIFRNGDLVYTRAFFLDPDNDAVGFGFQGTTAQTFEDHPWSQPSYGNVSRNASPGEIEYPFNLVCSTSPENAFDLNFWIDYTALGEKQALGQVHLTCTTPIGIETPYPVALPAVVLGK